MTIAEKMWSYEDYYKLNDDKRYEVLEGDLEMVPAPDANHQNITTNIQRKFYTFIYEKKVGRVFNAPYDVILDDKNVVQPDILIILEENIKKIKKRGLFGSPDLAVEIISYSSRYRDTEEKKDLYEKFGVKEYWIVDPKSHYIEILTLNENGKYELYSEGYPEDDKNIIKSKLFDGLEINIADIFDREFTD